MGRGGSRSAQCGLPRLQEQPLAPAGDDAWRRAGRMIISRTPFRISFFGGGTDYPQWFREHGGAVIGATINKFCYLSVRSLPPFFEHRHRIVYSQVELVRELGEIRHPAVRA